MSHSIEQIIEQMREAAEATTTNPIGLATVGGVAIGKSDLLAVLSALKEAQDRAGETDGALRYCEREWAKERATMIDNTQQARAERDALALRLEASEAEQARLIADLDGAKDAATVAYKEEVARLTAERAALERDRDHYRSAVEKATEYVRAESRYLRQANEEIAALKSELTAEMLMLWREYAAADGDTLTPTARKLGAELLAAFDVRIDALRATMPKEKA